MGYASFKSSPKNLIKAEDIGPGQIQLFHLDPGLFAQIQKVGLHNHSGVGSRRITLDQIDGAFGKGGFIMYSNDGTKRYRITVDNSGVISATAI